LAVEPRTQPELTFRGRKILYALIAEYVATGEPVGSRRLSRRYGLALSPASIRNVLADLEEMGLLCQPHTSAGRIPTEQGFRLFVDALVQMRQVTVEDRASILKRLGELRPGEDDVMRETGVLLSSLTGAAVVISAPRPGEEPLARIRFVPIRAGQVLAVLVSRSGAVQNRIVQIGEDLASSEIERIHNYLEERVDGRSLTAVRESLAAEMATERGRYDALVIRTRTMVDAAAEGQDQPVVVVEGQETLFDRPEFADVEKIRAYLRTFQDREQLLELLDRTLSAGGVQVLIGSEANIEAVQDISVVSTRFGHARGRTGALGVIGPTRMDYGKVVPLVEFTAQAMGRLLDGDDDEDAGPED